MTTNIKKKLIDFGIELLLIGAEAYVLGHFFGRVAANQTVNMQTVKHGLHIGVIGHFVTKK